MMRSAAVLFDAPRMIRRALVLWVLGRVAIMMVARTPTVALPFGSAVIVAAVVAMLCHVDARAMREPIFFANLGRPAWVPVAVGCAVACTLELLIAALVQLVLS